MEMMYISSEYKTQTETKTIIVWLNFIVYLSHTTQTSQQKQTLILHFTTTII